ncbi:MAG: apt [Bacteroidetes bacterium]|nr:apt [Bacteroidota bacterium]
MTNEELKKTVRNIPDFPIPGIQFKDVTPLFEEPQRLQSLSKNIIGLYQNKGISKVVGIESRGFILGPIIALNLDAGFVPARKPGKLPASIIEETYEKEYGKDAIQIHVDALNENDIVLLHDDLLATGGTMAAAYRLIKKMGIKKVYINFIIELEELEGRKWFPEDVEIESLIKFPI